VVRREDHTAHAPHSTLASFDRRVTLAHQANLPASPPLVCLDRSCAATYANGHPGSGRVRSTVAPPTSGPIRRAQNFRDEVTARLKGIAPRPGPAPAGREKK